MKRFSLNNSTARIHSLADNNHHAYTLDELCSNSPEFVSKTVLDLLPVGENVWNAIGTKITRLPDEEDRSKKGIYVAIGPKGITTRTTQGQTETDDIYPIVGGADRVLFIAEDGSVRVVKDRYQNMGCCLLALSK